jgi:hypothetical protein
MPKGLSAKQTFLRLSLPIIDTRRSGEKFGQKAFRSKSGIASPETDNAVDHVGVFH